MFLAVLIIRCSTSLTRVGVAFKIRMHCISLEGTSQPRRRPAMIHDENKNQDGCPKTFVPKKRSGRSGLQASNPNSSHGTRQCRFSGMRQGIHVLCLQSSRNIIHTRSINRSIVRYESLYMPSVRNPCTRGR